MLWFWQGSGMQHEDLERRLRILAALALQQVFQYSEQLDFEWQQCAI